MHCEKSVVFLSLAQVILIILFVFLTKYDYNVEVTYKYARNNALPKRAIETINFV